MYFELVANSWKATETVACFSSAQDVMTKRPVAIVGTDFYKLPVTSLDEVKAAFAQVQYAGAGEIPRRTWMIL
jgi:hypothetical protein